LALDETRASEAARDFAVDMAHRAGAELTGITIVDLPFITAGEAVPIGGLAYKESVDRHEIAEAEARRQRLNAAFSAICKARNVAHELVARDGEPFEAVLRGAETHDLVVMGHDASFHGSASEGVVATARELLKAHPRPMVIMPDAVPSGDEILVLYDGSLPAMRALQLFALMGIAGKASRVQVLVVGDSDADSFACGSRARDYLAAHGVKADVNAIVSDDTPSDVIAQTLASMTARLVVMGAFGHTGLTGLFFGSTTRSLLNEMPAPLFIYH
jgi:nucleotide-binding universal stress UspA family protein